MKKDEVDKLEHGVYIINWKSGGQSLAAVGSLNNGTRWYAPTNWCSQTPKGIGCTDWSLISTVVLLETSQSFNRSGKYDPT